MFNFTSLFSNWIHALLPHVVSSILPFLYAHQSGGRALPKPACWAAVSQTRLCLQIIQYG